MQLINRLLLVAVMSIAPLHAHEKIQIEQAARLQRYIKQELDLLHKKQQGISAQNATIRTPATPSGTPENSSETVTAQSDQQASTNVLSQAKSSEEKVITMPLPEIDPTHSIDFAYSGLFQKSGYLDRFVLGARTITGESYRNYALTCCLVDRVSNPPTINLIGLADENGAALSAFTVAQPSSTYPFPIAAVADQNELYSVPQLFSPQLALTHHTDLLKDAAGTLLTNQGAVALAAGLSAKKGSVLFAAVAENGSSFGNPSGQALPSAAQRGILPLLISQNREQILADALACMLKATAVNDSDAQQQNLHLAFFGETLSTGNPGSITGALFNNNVALYWHEKLERLYIGLSGVRRNDDHFEGGIMALTSGRFDSSGKFLIEPVIHTLKKSYFYVDNGDLTKKNVIDLIIGFYFNGQANNLITQNNFSKNNGQLPMELSLKKITGMSCSTGKEYLIVQSAGPDQLETSGDTYLLHGIFALPLLGKTFHNGTPVPEEQQGTIATPDFSSPVNSFEKMARASDEACRVGGDKSFVQPVGDDVADLFVEGDTVYIAMKGSFGQNLGLYQSTALFNEDGAVISWTPWQPCAGITGRVFTAKRSSSYGDYLFATEKTPFDPASNPPATDANTIAFSHWGKGTETTNLATMLEAIFPAEEGGVYQIIDVSAQTKSFEPGELSMLIALGKKKVALIKTGRYYDTNKILYPITDHKLADPDKTIFVFDDPILEEIGPLTCAAVTSGPTQVGLTNGYLFVGGYKGVAVLTNVAGNGFQPPLKDLSSAEYPGTDFSFKKVVFAGDLPIITSCKKIAATGFGITFAADDTLYTIDSMNLGSILPSTPLAINKSTPCPGAAISDYRFIWNGPTEADSRSLFLVGTSKGLFYSSDRGRSWKELAINGELGLPVTQLFYLSNNLSFDGPIGNLFALQAYRSTVPSVGELYRFSINLSSHPTIKPIVTEFDKQGIFINFGEYRGALYYDGSLALTSRGLHFNDTNFLNNTPVTQRSRIIPLTPYLQINENRNYAIGVPVRESCSGMLLLPGDWAVRLQT